MAKQATSSSVTDTLVSTLSKLSKEEQDAIFTRLATAKEITRDVPGLSQEIEKEGAISYSDLAEKATRYGWPRNFTEHTAGQRGTTIVKVLTLRAQSRVFSKGKLEEVKLMLARGIKVVPFGYMTSLKGLVESGDRSPELMQALMETVGAVSM